MRPERQHGADVVDETGGKNDLAEFDAVEAGLDHHGIDDRHRRRGQCDAADLRLRPGPAKAVSRQQQAAEIGREESHQPDRHARSEVSLDHVRIDVGAGEKREHDRTEAGDVIDPGRERHAYRVARDGADDDLEKRGRDRYPERSHGGDQGERHPQRRLKPDIVHRLHPFRCRRPRRKKTRSPAGHEKDPLRTSNAAGVISSVERFWGTPSPSAHVRFYTPKSANASTCLELFPVN